MDSGDAFWNDGASGITEYETRRPATPAAAAASGKPIKTLRRTSKRRSRHLREQGAAARAIRLLSVATALSACPRHTQALRTLRSSSQHAKDGRRSAHRTGRAHGRRRTPGPGGVRLPGRDQPAAVAHHQHLREYSRARSAATAPTPSMRFEGGAVYPVQTPGAPPPSLSRAKKAREISAFASDVRPLHQPVTPPSLVPFPLPPPPIFRHVHSPCAKAGWSPAAPIGPWVQTLSAIGCHTNALRILPGRANTGD
eukprot:350866-Chlamydomonas_euryale.AAC.9